MRRRTLAEKHFRLRDAPPSPLRYDAIAPKPEAKAEKRRFGATTVRLVTSAATALRTILEPTLRRTASLRRPVALAGTAAGGQPCACRRSRSVGTDSVSQDS